MKNSTRSALVISFIAILLCVTMLIGTTFAWFTDSASTGVNKIVSGNLDVALEMKDASGNWVSAEGKVLNWITTDDRPADEILWEPGCRYQLPELRIINKGTLALDYTLEIEGVSGDAKLLEVIDFTYGNGITIGQPVQLLPGQSTEGLQISAVMQTSAGNEYQNLCIFDIAVKLTAKQSVHEEDSFGNDYDLNALGVSGQNLIERVSEGYVAVSSATQLSDALANGSNIVLASDISLTDETFTVPTGKSVTFDTNGYTISSVSPLTKTYQMIKVSSNSTLTLVGNGVLSAKATAPDNSPMPYYASNVIVNEGTLVVDGPRIENKTIGGAATYCIDTRNGSTTTIESGEILNYDNYAIRIFASENTNATDLIVNGGTIRGIRALWVQLAGSKNTFAPTVNVTFNGGNIETSEALDDPRLYCQAVYCYSFGNDKSNVTFTFNDGNFIGDIAFGGGAKVGEETVTINGGTYKSYADNCIYRYTSNGPVYIPY